MLGRKSLLIHFRFALLLTIITVMLSSCIVQKHHFISGKWKINEHELTISNQSKNICFIYNPDEDRYMRPYIKESLLAPDKGRYLVDKFSDKVLKKVGYDAQKDSIYFILQGHMILFSSPTFDLSTANNFIDLLSKQNVNGEYPALSMNYYGKKEIRNHCVYSTIYISRKKKQCLVKDVFKYKNGYLNFVYIIQSKTKNNKKLSPRVWTTEWDVTDPINILFTGRILQKRNKIAVLNLLKEGHQPLYSEKPTD